jgi:hypothetical protein
MSKGYFFGLLFSIGKFTFVNMDILKSKMIEAMKAHRGFICRAAKDVGISRQTHYNWLSKDHEYKEIIAEIEEAQVDHTESKLYELIDGVRLGEETKDGLQIYQEAPNVTAIIFHLKSKGKKRGYVEKQVMEIAEPESKSYDLNKLTDDELREFNDIEKRREELLSKCIISE